jgi:hypothetical protein
MSDDCTSALAAQQEQIAGLFDAIAHGDDEHRAWLKQAIDDHFAGRPVERVRGTNSATLESTVSAQAALAEKRREEIEAAHRETGELRQGITKALGMEWHKVPSGGAVCPDDKDIIAACSALRRAPGTPAAGVWVPVEPTDEATQQVYDKVAALTTEPTFRLTYSNLQFVYRQFIAAMIAAKP